MPRNASLGADGFRFYEWAGGDTPLNRKYGAVEPANLLSVTSIRTLCGTPFPLVNWQINNVVRLAMGTRKTEWRDYSKSKRGRRVEGYRPDGDFPGEFIQRVLATEGDPERMTAEQQWLRQTAEQPRDIAAVRGSVVHKLIELGVTADILGRDMIEQRIERQWAEESHKVKVPTTEEDIAFVADAMDNYFDMRTHVPFVVLAQEPQIFNLVAGYAGSADLICWFLGEYDVDGVFHPFEWATPERTAELQRAADDKSLDLGDIEGMGGTVCVGDWKTSGGVYTSHVVQTIAYMAGLFIATDGVIDERLTAILRASMLGMVIHIRPDHWSVDGFAMREDALLAFLGSVAYARFLAQFKEPSELFLFHHEGSAPGIERSESADDDG